MQLQITLAIIAALATIFVALIGAAATVFAPILLDMYRKRGRRK